ncbi:ankyrin repeat-containing domain protein [Triangularia verruculosa]|uniref:Ankyrin repeat-containing domain protein n=1 Tax=Triangularia verruculosa TaxID=2587418 RepID=A0AAN6XU49_9PEZI|nr:ankyrin repeat-containing domain protein [Triangularia verruculosa]
MDMDTSMQMDVDIVGSDEDVDIIDVDDVSTYNPANILPETPHVIAQIRKWLQPTAYSIEGGEYRRHLASHAPGTGHWLPSTAQYVKWHDSPEHGLLWIKGIPGSGKSVFAARLAHDLANEGHPVLYFFFRQIIDANHKPFNLLCDWLDQIVEYSPPLQKTLKAYVDEKSDTRRALDSVGRNDLWMHLKAALAQSVGRVYLVADALDEMDNGNDEFLRELADLASWKPAKVKVLITSRPVTAVEEPLRRVPALQIRLEEQFVDIDIATFVRTSLEASSISADDQIQIKEAVPGRANGLFLYAKLAMDAFLEPQADIQQVMTALPLDLNAMYTDLLREHSQRSAVPGDLQLLILSWVTHATRPLRLLELAAILKSTCSDANMDMREAKQLVRAACGPLLEIQPDETVSVIHHSLTEFLLDSTRSADAASYPILAPGPTHERLAVSCLHYLSTGCLDGIKLEETEENSSYIDYGSDGPYKSHSSAKLKHAFLGYAAENWTVHVAKSARAGLTSELLPPILDGFLMRGPTFDAWLEMVWHPLATQGVTPLHAAARYGLTQYILILAGRPDTVLNCVDVLRQTPLYHAADQGHHETVKALLAAGADPDPDNYAGLKPLHQAARKNHAAVVAALLASGVDPLTPKTRENPGRRCGNAATTRGHTPLMYACQAGHLETVESFLQYLKATEVVGEALRWAIGSRRSGLVKRLIQVPGLDINARVDLKWLHGNTLFFEACLAGDVESMELLAEAGADTTVLGYGPRNKFARGAAGSCDGRMSALNAFCLGISILHDDDLSRTKVDLVKRGLDLLIKAGADVNRCDGMLVPLHRATTSPTLLRLLLEAGADPNVEDTDGSTLLHTPRHDDAGFDINRLLVEEGNADVNKRRTDGKTPLMVYLEDYNTEACIRFLESFSPDCTLTDKGGNGPLHLAIGGRNGIPLNQLIQSGSRFADRSPAGIDKFLELGASINTRDHKGRTLLHQIVASSSGYPSRSRLADSKPLDTLRHLVSLGLDVKATDYSGNTLLHTLIDQGHDRLTKTVRARFEMLIASGADPDAVNYSGSRSLKRFLSRPNIISPKSGSLYLRLTFGLPQTYYHLLYTYYSLNIITLRNVLIV